MTGVQTCALPISGTLIALYMMKHHGFSARAAMGWLRIVRPGSVIGEQQHFLCAREALMRRSAAPLAAAAGITAADTDALRERDPAAAAAASQRVINEISRVVSRRHAAAAAAAAASSAAADGGALAAHVAEAAERRCTVRAGLDCPRRRGGSD